MRIPNFSLERKLDGVICGIDEAGRGPLAGPVVAAAVILPKTRRPKGLNDSKKLTPQQRAECYEDIIQKSIWAVGHANVDEIDRINILHATMLAMQRAYLALNLEVHHALVDGNRPPQLGCTVHTVIGGDALSLSIAAASIVAKVTRDRLMHALAAEFPHYGFERHVGYSTPEHLDALKTHGPCPHHRRSFAPVRILCDQQTFAFA